MPKSHSSLRTLVPALLLASCSAATSPTPPAASPRALGGEMIYMADAPRITECLSGRSYPLAQDGDYLAMERAYLDTVKAAGAPLYVTIEGVVDERPKTEGAGTQSTMVVKRFINAWPSQACERARADSSLVNTRWRIVRLAGQSISVIESRREPNLSLRNAEGSAGYSATVGCNQLAGIYTLKGDALAFSAGMSTLMACPAPLGEWEQSLSRTLAQVRHWRVTGPTLELADDQGQSLALLEAVYLQ